MSSSSRRFRGIAGGNNGPSSSSRSTSPRDRYGTLEDEFDDDDEPRQVIDLTSSAAASSSAPTASVKGKKKDNKTGTSTVDYLLQSDSEDSPGENDGLMRSNNSNNPRSSRRFTDTGDPYESEEDYDGEDSEDDEEGGPHAMSLQELLYSSSSYYAIAKPVTVTMVLAALAVVFVNNDETRAEGEQAMASAYQVWSTNDSNSSATQNLAFSLANALVMVTVICCMTFVIVLLYKFRCMMCLIGYMMICSGTLLGVLGGNLLQVAIHIYRIPVDKITFFLFIVNFCLVGVAAVFWGKGIPKYVTQGYLVATSVILAWHLSYFDDWTTWSLLFMLALYDLCAVLTPCGPLKALVTLMSEEEAPEMPGLLFEAELPSEAKRPGIPKSNTGGSGGRLSRSNSTISARSSSGGRGGGAAAEGTSTTANVAATRVADATVADVPVSTSLVVPEGPIINIPLAIAKVYNLPIIDVPQHSKQILFPSNDNHSRTNGSTTNASSSPLLQDDGTDLLSGGVLSNTTTNVVDKLPDNPTPSQLRATVTVRLPIHGGRIEQVSRRGKRVYLERDRHGEPKRLLWVDRNGKVFAELRSDDEDGPERNTIRLGLGDFIFYSVLVAKAAQYSFATFAACVLVILAGLGGTLVLLSVYHHALPALPISIFLGVVCYLMTRAFIEPWIEAVLSTPLYV